MVSSEWPKAKTRERDRRRQVTDTDINRTEREREKREAERQRSRQTDRERQTERERNREREKKRLDFHGNIMSSYKSNSIESRRFSHGFTESKRGCRVSAYGSYILRVNGYDVFAYFILIQTSRDHLENVKNNIWKRWKRLAVLFRIFGTLFSPSDINSKLSPPPKIPAYRPTNKQFSTSEADVEDDD